MSFVVHDPTDTPLTNNSHNQPAQWHMGDVALEVWHERIKHGQSGGTALHHSLALESLVPGGLHWNPCCLVVLSEVSAAWRSSLESLLSGGPLWSLSCLVVLSGVPACCLVVLSGVPAAWWSSLESLLPGGPL